MKKLALIIAFAAALTGCDLPKPDVTMVTQTQSAAQGRISINRIGVFSDQLAYNGLRGIYIIRDSKTGKEYLGVSGIGISELGSHQVGKNIIQDER